MTSLQNISTIDSNIRSSRIIVKNIGKTTTENQLRDHFNQKGEVTDVRIQKTKSGKSREFAFIGFRTEQQAIDAQHYFNNTFLNTARISVDIARSIHDPTLLVNSRSRHTKNKLEKQKLLAKKETESKKKPEGKKKTMTESQERSKAEFLEVMKSRSNANVWGNDDAHIRLAQEKLQQSAEQSDSDESDNDEYDDIILDNSKSSTHEKFSRNSDESDSEVESETDDGIVKGKHTSISDLDFLRGKIKTNIKEDSESDSESDQYMNDEPEQLMTVNDDHEDSGHDDQMGDRTEEPASEEEEGRLFVRNLPYSVSEDELTELFSTYGPISHVSYFSNLTYHSLGSPALERR